LNRTVAQVVIAASFLLGASSLALFSLFLVRGPSFAIDLALPARPALALDAGFCLLFFLQQSGMIRRGFRRRFSGLVPEHFHGAVYTIASAAALFVLVAFWQQVTPVLFEARGPLRWAFRAPLLLGLFVFCWAAWALHSFDPFGVTTLRDRLRGGAASAPEFVARGPYLLVRHPFYLSALLIIWSYPRLTADRLLFNVLWTVWIVVGSILEERDLAATFGDRYREYQRRVPMLLPLPRRS
jgi:protein-S-isoprenylcysteine O-methyltransferase Ste14